MRARYLAFVVVTWIILVSGVANSYQFLVPEAALHDATPRRNRIPLRLEWAEVTSGRFQSELEQRIAEAWGFRRALILTDNSLNHWFLRETRHRKPVVVGHDGVLFSREDVHYYNRTDVCVACDELARRLGRLQRQLLANGRLLLPVIVPAKTTVERAALPDRWRRVSGPPPSDDQIYGRMVAALVRENVIFVDGRARLLAVRAETGQPVFPPEARHWSHYSACLVYGDAIATAATTLALPIGPADVPACDPAMSWPPTNHDLARVMNVWGARGGRATPLPVPPVHRTDLRPVVVGSSFMYDFARLLRMSTFGAGARYYFYDDGVIDVTTQETIGKVAPADPAWVRWTRERNLYVVDLFESYLPEAGFGRFLDQLETIFAQP